MRFGKTLQDAIYEPWKPYYIDYKKLKRLLREDQISDSRHPSSSSSGQTWTEEDEGRFVDELVNVQLEKVNTFHADTYQSLRDRATKCEAVLEKLNTQGDIERDQEDPSQGLNKDEDDISENTLKELDNITKDTNELEKYSRINYTGFLKAAKKHDRRRGSNYKVRPLLQVRLAALPFNSEDYSPLLYRMSAMYMYLRHQVQPHNGQAAVESALKGAGSKYKSYKFWVHPENLLEVKTYIVRHLPVLVYNPQTSKIVEGGQHDPTITSLYFDSPQFSLYNNKVSKVAEASSLRLRWFGHLSDKPEIFIEKKTTQESGASDEVRFSIKEKYIQPFISGSYKMERQLEKLQNRQHTEPEDIQHMRESVEMIQRFLSEKDLHPMLRANYTRTAFQIPGDDRIRMSLDTDMAFIREDALDHDRPCRDPDDWHRTDIDRNKMEFPFPNIKQGEISRFPYALLEIKIKENPNKRINEWITELMSSHLVKEAPKFSRFVHGVAQLFEDNVNTFPFWLSDLETDIRKDPESAFQEEQEKKAKQAEDKQAVGSFLGSKSPSSFIPPVGSPAGKFAQQISSQDRNHSTNEIEADRRHSEAVETDTPDYGTESSAFRSLLPSFSGSKYALTRRRKSLQLPPGVKEPGRLIKDSGPVRVEPKVWLANQRTFVKWQHICVLLATLSLALYNGASESNSIARGLAVVYVLIAVFAGVGSLCLQMQCYLLT
ncbi:MAG: hypothetical protein Q9167_001373 [Letrouitia subvulpina]